MSTWSGPSEALCAVHMSPAVVKTRSDRTLVAGTERRTCATVERRGCRQASYIALCHVMSLVISLYKPVFSLTEPVRTADTLNRFYRFRTGETASPMCVHSSL